LHEFFPFLFFAVFDLYNTDLSKPSDGYDCLRMTRLETSGSESLEYCRRTTEKLVRQKSGDCPYHDPTSFTQWAQENMTDTHLQLEAIPVDIIDAYMLYLETGTGKNQFVCHCMGYEQVLFGIQCEYKYPVILPLTGRGETYENFFGYLLDSLEENLYQTPNTHFNINVETCYIDLPGCITQMGTCLHWNQICDGKFKRKFLFDLIILIKRPMRIFFQSKRDQYACSVYSM
jgi:hypothetical protein